MSIGRGKNTADQAEGHSKSSSKGRSGKTDKTGGLTQTPRLSTIQEQKTKR